MSNLPLPPDQPQREQALDPAKSILVQAPAGSGKTDLLTRRFLCLLAEVEDPAQVVAITFTKAAAAEMRHRILSELENAAVSDAPPSADPFSMEALARRALKRSQALDWNLIDLPSQLRISTIDSFCRDLALQQPLLSGLGGGLDIAEQPEELYRRAARQTLENLDQADPALRAAIESLLLWRDNNWQEMEKLLVQMLAQRDRWMRDFVLDREPDPEELRQRLERPFAAAVQEALAKVSLMLDKIPGAREEILTLARFACEQSGNTLHCELAELTEFPAAPFADIEALEEARAAWLALASLLLTGGGTFRKSVDKRLGFPADHKREKAQLLELIRRLEAVPGLEAALAAVRALPPSRYSEDEWQIVRSCFTLLRHAAGQLKVVFAEAARVDYTEVAQTALHVLKGEEGLPSDTALALADGIRHILVDEFQDTSRRQHELLAHLIAAWPDPSGRTCFVVGDPMQSIYFFRDADAELFPRVREAGLELPNAEPLLFDSVRLKANFRTAPPLVSRLNEVFEKVFAADDGSGVTFSSAQPAREETAPEPAASNPRLNLHLKFIPQTSHGRSSNPNASRKKEETAAQREASRKAQTAEIVALIQSRMERMQQAHAEGKKYRIAVLGRTRSALAPVAEALRQAAIPFRAVDLEQLSTRPEVLDVVAMSRAVLNPQDRVAWLGLLRAPWCGLSLVDLHILTSADDSELLTRPVPDLLAERLPLLSSDGRQAAERVQEALAAVPGLRFTQPAASLGTWLEQIWIRLGGAQCVDATARANLDLLWRCLDSLPEGEQDLLGPALGVALNKLAAQPDPDASSDCGVQLMTIHKSKGLEFEVVIIPDLQAGSGRGSIKLLSWLERGLAQPDQSGAITEFLVAPLQTKGADRGQAKNWVDRAYRERESQETRRILYVAATRAREELHIFARPSVKTEKDGSLSLADPTGSLLATAWPALEDEVRARFAAWQVETSQSEAAASPAKEVIIDSIAASGESNLLVMPSPIKPTLLRRLPPNYRPTQSNAEPYTQRLGAPGLVSETRGTILFARHEGGLLSRALGTAVHALLEKFSQLREANDWEAARAALQQFEPRIAAEVRSVGVDAAKAASIAAEALRHVLLVSQDPIGQWILSPHAEAASETRWAGVISGTLRTVQVDRVFRAGSEPGAIGEDVWWIIDYKTAHPEGLDPQAALPGLRRLFSPQVESYAQVLRHLHGANAAIRAALYYPRMMALDWWEL
jgi:ATP-dependent exoDNAse (exonuclease V) beta subunit